MSTRHHIIKLLDRLQQTDAYADILLENELRKMKLTAADRALTQEIFFGVIRWQKRLDWIIGTLYRGSINKAPRFIRHILQCSLYQLIFMDKIPDYAAINEAVELAKSWGNGYWGKKVNAILRSFQREKQVIRYPDLSKNPVEHIAVVYSHPEWMVERWINRFGVEETIELCRENNRNPAVSLRVNELKTSVSNVQETLASLGIETTRASYPGNFLLTSKIPGLNQLEPFQQGWFSVQDPGAGIATVLLDARPGERIIDLCAAPGGKTTFLAEMSRDQAAIFAVDLNRSRLKLIRQNLRRLGLSSVQLIQADGTIFSTEPVDKILVDVPCSGLGVLAKRVDLRWKRTPDQLKQLTQVQLKLLNNAARLLKPGGVLVYCTCTIEPEENEHIVRRFLAEHSEFRIDPAGNRVPAEFVNEQGFVATLPHRHHIDGSFAARLMKAHY